MSFERIRGILLLEYFVIKRNLEELFDVFYFPFVTTLVYGYVSLYLIGEVHSSRAQYLILGIVFWEIVRISQSSITQGVMWNIWSRNITNLFITPLTFLEMTIAHMLSGILKILIVFALISFLYIVMFQFNIFRISLVNLLLFSINLAVFSWAIGIMLIGLIFRFGTRIQVLTWSLIFLFQPVGAVFYPVSILPPFLQKIAYGIPITYIFEAARAALTDPAIRWDFIVRAMLLNAVYFLFAVWFFTMMFRKSKETGQFARNEG